MQSKRLSRRTFLRFSATASAAAGLTGAHALARSTGFVGGGDYRALVCVFLYGGADSLNLLVPTSPDEYAAYASARGNLAEAKSSLLPISTLDGGSVTHGLNAAVPELRDLFQSGRLAFVGNVGPLVQPSSKAGLTSGTVPEPTSLFSHNDQQASWQRAWADVPGATGWAGRMIDAMGAVNGSTVLPPGISVDQQNVLQVGVSSAPYVIGTEGLLPFAGTDDPERKALFQGLVGNEQHPLGRALAKTQGEAMAIYDQLAPVLSSAPAFDGLFPESELGLQLRKVAQLIAIRKQLGVSRQVFFVSAGGFDTHDGQLQLLPGLFASLSKALGAFQSAVDQLGEANNVTTFSHSEFGRTLSSNGKGSDHGWGGHAFAFGGAVAGQRIYGTMPELTLEGPDDLGEGRLIPTTSVDQYANTLASWFGLDANAASAVFPNLSKFSTADLGFLS